MLWLLAIVPVLAGLGVHASGLRGRIPLAGAAGLTLAITLALALLAAFGDWRGALDWGPVLDLRAALVPVSAVVAITVPAVALPIALYAAVHEDRPGLTRLIALLLAFVGAMELLVIAADLLTLLMGWELVGACSWALIGHHWQDAANPAAGRYAFVTTRLGDLGLFLAAMAAFAGTGSFAYAGLSQIDGPLLQLLVFGLLLSAAAKSGQVPFAPWLFRAMAGPTSVSALLHAATMVAAGAFLLARLQPLLDRVGWFAPAAIAIGLVTALAGGLVALSQADAKKLLAASTSAQFGLMFVAVGAGYPAVAMLHLVTHAGFKALLFLAAGVAGQRAGGFRLADLGYGRALPGVAALSAIGALALAGVPPLGGAWSKEAIVAAAGHAGPALAVGVIVAGGLSAAYAARFQFLAYGPGNDRSAGVFGPRRLETTAFAALAAACLLLSALWLPSVREAAAASLAADLPQSKTWELTLSLAAVAIGLVAGPFLGARHRALGTAGSSAAASDWLGLPAVIRTLVIRPVATLARTAARLDDQGVDALPRGVAALGRRLSGTGGRLDDRAVDALPRGAAMLGRRLAAAGGRVGERLADGLPEGLARIVGTGATDVRGMQSGMTQHYYAAVVVGAAVLTVVLLLGSFA